jgi:hypothetical protein
VLCFQPSKEKLDYRNTSAYSNFYVDISFLFHPRPVPHAAGCLLLEYSRLVAQNFPVPKIHMGLDGF